ncbi:hypothetical protein JTE90_026179 [Oedothorax gibbosus]|uniref:Uncharacterized protein n=1 Tax=Oedothorax gibbosus TaxID=931172 RepID=A0AAV6UGA1_9ARAC|nr:hypothetical protein JTE90_026179 [Oedothorax gibbosus]
MAKGRCYFLLQMMLFQGFSFLAQGIEIKPFHFTDNLREGLRTAAMCVVLDGDPPFDFEWSSNKAVSFLRQSSRRCQNCGHVCGHGRRSTF